MDVGVWGESAFEGGDDAGCREVFDDPFGVGFGDGNVSDDAENLFEDFFSWFVQ